MTNPLPTEAHREGALRQLLADATDMLLRAAVWPADDIQGLRFHANAVAHRITTARAQVTVVDGALPNTPNRAATSGDRVDDHAVPGSPEPDDMTDEQERELAEQFGVTFAAPPTGAGETPLARQLREAADSLLGVETFWLGSSQALEIAETLDQQAAEIAMYSEAVKRRNLRVNDLEAEIATLKGQLDAADQHVEILDSVAATFQAQLQARDEQIAQLKAMKDGATP